MKERATMWMALAVLALLVCCLPVLVEGPGETVLLPEPVQCTAVWQGQACLIPPAATQPQPPDFRADALPVLPERVPVPAPARDSNGHPLALTAAYVDAVPEAFPPESVKG